MIYKIIIFEYRQDTNISDYTNYQKKFASFPVDASINMAAK